MNCQPCMYTVVWKWSIWLSLIQLVVIAQQEMDDIRLSGGNSPREGRLEVYIGGTWGSICDRSWNIAEADVVCKQLNLSYAISAPRNAAFGEGKGHLHPLTFDCHGHEGNIGDCVRGVELSSCGHSDDVSVVCSDRGQPRGYDVRIIGGSHPSTGQVEIYLNKQWSILCTTPWSVIEADAVCRQSGYGGALYAEGIIPVPIDRPPSNYSYYTGLLDCSKGSTDVRGYGHLFGCKNDLVLEPSGFTCEWPNTVACTRHQAELPVRLFGGKSNSSGRVEVSYGGVWWGICPEQWHLTDANVVCHQLGYSNSAAFKNSAMVAYPEGQDSRFYLMSDVNCTGEESNIGHCARVYGAHNCQSGDYASVTCEDYYSEICILPKSVGPCKAAFPAFYYDTETESCEYFVYGGCQGNDNRFHNKPECEKLCGKINKDRIFNKTVITVTLCLLIIPVLLLLLFVTVYCVYKKRSREENDTDAGHDEKTSYSLINQKESVEKSQEAKEELKEPVKV